jgi:hypothetical protein
MAWMASQDAEEVPIHLKMLEEVGQECFKVLWVPPLSTARVSVALVSQLHLVLVALTIFIVVNKGKEQRK